MTRGNPRHENQANLGPHTKARSFFYFTQNQVNFDLNKYGIKSISIDILNQINFDVPTRKQCQCRSPTQ